MPPCRTTNTRFKVKKMKTTAALFIGALGAGLSAHATPVVDTTYPYTGPAIPIGDWVDQTVNGNGKGFRVRQAVQSCARCQRPSSCEPHVRRCPASQYPRHTVDKQYPCQRRSPGHEIQQRQSLSGAAQRSQPTVKLGVQRLLKPGPQPRLCIFIAKVEVVMKMSLNVAFKE